MYTYIIIKCIGGSRHFERGREEDGVSPRRHLSQMHTTNYRVARKSKPLPDDQTIVLNRIKACQWD